MAKGEKNLVVSIDEDLHHKLKVYCAEQKITIKDLIMKLIVREIEQSQKRG